MIRAATSHDMSACAAIFNRWVDETEWMPRVHDHDDVVRHYRETVFTQCEVFVAESDGVVGAFLALSDHAFVNALYADPHARGRGFGKLLLERAKARYPGGLQLWTFVANEDAQRFYRREGFTEVRRTQGDNEEGLPDILLRWPGAVAA